MTPAIPNTADLEKAVTLSKELADLESDVEAKTAEFEKSIAEDRQAIQEKASELSRLLGQSSTPRRRGGSAAKASASNVLAQVPSGKDKAISSADVAEALDTVTGSVSSVLKELEDGGQLKSVGERRGKKYYR